MTDRLVSITAVAAVAAVVSASALAGAAKQQFTISSTSTASRSGPTHVVATGPIDGRGSVAVRSSDNSRVDHMTLRLAGGAVFLTAVEKAYSVRPDPAKCLATAVGNGRFDVTGGTGRYADAHGSGTYVRHGVLYGARNAAGVCLSRKAPIARTTTRVVMTGSVALT